jgi:hypothetical protein
LSAAAYSRIQPDIEKIRGANRGIIGALFDFVNAAPKIVPDLAQRALLRCIADPAQTQ